MKPNRIFKTTEMPYPAVDAVLNYGFAVISDDTSLAVPFGNKVIAALKPCDDVEPHVDYIGLYYVVVDLNRFPGDERRGHLAQEIEALTSREG